MKMFTLAAAGLVALTGVAPAMLTTPAAAQHTVVHERTVVHTSHSRNYRHRTRRVCRYEYRHHHHVRVCRTVRY